MSTEIGTPKDSDERSTSPAVRADESPALSLVYINSNGRVASLARQAKKLRDREAQLRSAVAEQSKQYERLRELTAMQLRVEHQHGSTAKLVIISAFLVLVDVALLVMALLEPPSTGMLVLGLAVVAGLGVSVTVQLIMVASLRDRAPIGTSRVVDQLFARASGR